MKCLRMLGGLRVLGLCASIAAVLASTPPAYAQRVFTYVDENGVRVFTNIPPKNSQAPTPDPMPEPKASKGLPRAASRTALRPLVPPESPSREPDSPGHSPSSPYDSIIDRYAGEYRLDPPLVRSIIASESGFNPGAISRKGARGLMQLMPGTASRLGVQNITDPEENIRGGMKHLRNLLDTFDNDLVLSLAAYNAGENLVQRIGRIPNFPETHAYVRSVTRRYGRTDMATISPQKPSYPRTFRYFDEHGTLHLTDTPPPRRMESDVTPFTMGTPSP